MGVQSADAPPQISPLEYIIGRSVNQWRVYSSKTLTLEVIMASTDRFAVGYTGPTGISGWLALLIFWFALQVIVYSLALIALRHTVGIIFFESLFFAGFAAVTGYLLFIKNEKGVLLAKLYLIARFSALVIEILIAGKTPVLRGVYGICMLIAW